MGTDELIIKASKGGSFQQFSASALVAFAGTEPLPVWLQVDARARLHSKRKLHVNPSRGAGDSTE